ncbi:hypothetical protein ABZT16_34190 [Streptomyces flaveolus]|uniref:Integral membrane protein n=1 Tax=Streptomyces flaveolus TaxID=67297 RepID=A0ABV3A3H2_9ACTN|nr:hypothetical protein [Streptomyces antibioticus]
MAAFAHGPVVVGGATVFAAVLEGVLAGTPCCAGREVGCLWDRHYVASYVCTGLVGALGMILAAHHVRRERTLADVRFVADIAQRVLLRATAPPPTSPPQYVRTAHAAATVTAAV